MQGPTHILAGVVIQRIFSWRYFSAIASSLIIFLGLLSHGILDKVARATYHPPNAEFNNPFWLLYHVVIALTTIVMLYIFWRDYKLGIIFALLPDIDWIVLHTSTALGKELFFYKRPWLHDSINYVLDQTIPFCYLNLIPDQRLLPLACIWEVLLLGLLWLWHRLLIKQKRNIHF